MKKYLISSLSVSIGFLTGFNGGGGGIFAVLLLVYLLKMPEKNAHATAIFVILPLTVFSTVIYALFSKIDLSVTLPVTLGVIIGGLIGAFLLKNLKSNLVGYLFGAILLFSAFYMLFS